MGIFRGSESEKGGDSKALDGRNALVDSFRRGFRIRL